MGGTYVQKAHAAEENSTAFLIAPLGGVSLFLHSRYSLLLSHSPSYNKASRCHPVFAAKKFTLYSDGAGKERAAAAAFLLSHHPRSPLLLLLSLCGRAGALIWCAGDNDQLDKATCGVCVCVWARWHEARLLLSSVVGRAQGFCQLSTLALVSLRSKVEQNR